MHGVVWWRPASSNIIWYINQQVNIINLLHLRFSPPSEQTYSSPSSRDFTKTFKFDCSSALHNSSSEYWLNGSRFILRLPVRQTGNYITISRSSFIQFAFLVIIPVSNSSINFGSWFPFYTGIFITPLFHRLLSTAYLLFIRIYYIYIIHIYYICLSGFVLLFPEFWFHSLFFTSFCILCILVWRGKPHLGVVFSRLNHSSCCLSYLFSNAAIFSTPSYSSCIILPFSMARSN